MIITYVNTSRKGPDYPDKGKPVTFPQTRSETIFVKLFWNKMLSGNTEL